MTGLTCSSCGLRVDRIHPQEPVDPCPRCGAMRQPVFTCATTVHEDAARVVPEGELDIASVPELEAAVAAAFAGGVVRVVCDLRGVTFVDSTAIGRLLELSQTAAQRGREFALVGDGGAVARVLELMQVRDLLPFVDPEEEATP